jgi:hypothetical protein
MDILKSSKLQLVVMILLASFSAVSGCSNRIAGSSQINNEALKPSSDNIHFDDFCEEMAKAKEIRLHEDGKVLWIGTKTDHFTSGPPVYIFTPNGRLSSWDFSSGESEAINDELKDFKDSQKVSIEFARSSFSKP